MNEITLGETIHCPKGTILDAWSDSEWNHGVQIDQIEELTTLAVQTSNNLYEITVLNGHTGEVLVRGGEFFPCELLSDWRAARAVARFSRGVASTWVCGWRSFPSL